MWVCGGARFEFGPPVVMGIVNVTPDSFSDGGHFAGPDAAAAHARAEAAAGAAILDIGGESTRPGSKPVPEAEELRRVLPVFEALKGTAMVLSADTSKAAVARAALAAGAAIVNDVSGLRDPAMAEVLADCGCGYVLMHCQGTPETMQRAPRYADVVGEVLAFLESGLERLQRAGVARERVALDPGIGFGKTWAHNRALLLGLERFRALGRPVLVGVSRKSFVGAVTGTPVEARLGGTVAAEALAVWHGADVVRTHEAGPSAQGARMAWRTRFGEGP